MISLIQLSWMMWMTMMIDRYDMIDESIWLMIWFDIGINEMRTTDLMNDDNCGLKVDVDDNHDDSRWFHDDSWMNDMRWDVDEIEMRWRW